MTPVTDREKFALKIGMIGANEYMDDIAKTNAMYEEAKHHNISKTDADDMWNQFNDMLGEEIKEMTGSKGAEMFKP